MQYNRPLIKIQSSATAAIIFLGTMLSGCMPQPSTIAPQNLNKSFNERKVELENLKNWRLKGAIAVKENSKGFSASMVWHQKNTNSFDIQFSGPLGTGKVQVVKKGAQATLSDGQKTFTSNNVEQLLKNHTGHYIPVNSLFYWIRGLPDPTRAFQIKKDIYGHLNSLEQLGWQINYTRFTHFKNFDVPAKLILTKRNIRVKIIINQWQ